jgi:phosphomethylpyrimidine synthase
MKISQDIKEMDEETISKINEIQVEMDRKSKQFIDNDSEIYIKQQ